MKSDACFCYSVYIHFFRANKSGLTGRRKGNWRNVNRQIDVTDDDDGDDNDMRFMVAGPWDT